jgi:UDP-GlcNAc:undecaprenyl-phosphate GlcNAc-1-phosphate transferase
MENIFNDPVVIDNITNIISAGFISFIIAFLATPWVGKLAYSIKAIDLAPSLRSKNDRSLASRINEGTKPRLGGLAMFISIFITLLIATPVFEIRPEVFVSSVGIILGIIIITFVGFLDDKYEIPGIYQLFGHISAALVLIYFGIAIPDNINLLGASIDLNTFSSIINLGAIDYEFIFPGHIITVIWIVMIINFINWVGGVDGLNLSLSSVIAFTMLLFALSTSNIPLAILISIHIGANVGLFPYNYYPSHIIPGSIGDYLNGYLIAVFALLGDTRWTITMIILAIPVFDALLVIWARVRQHPEVLKNPLKILSISDTNHLHHRLMAAGYSRKTVMLIEIALVSILSAIAITFGINAEPDDTSDQVIIAFAVASTFLLIMFTTVSILKERSSKRTRIITVPTERKEEAVVKVIIDEDENNDDDYERFAY